MGLFSGMKNTFKKSEASLIVSNLLMIQKQAGTFNLDVEPWSRKIVDLTWDAAQNLFTGKFGGSPHKLSLAASALAYGSKLFDENDMNKNAVFLSLGVLLSDIEKNSRFYGFQAIDNEIISAAASVYEKYVTEYLNKKEIVPF